MSLNESIVEVEDPLWWDAAHEWFEGLGYVVGHGAAFAWLRGDKPQMAPGEPVAESGSF